MIYAIISMAVMGALFGVLLGVASKKFAVETDPREEAIISILPGANCGSCGYAGCAGYAAAVVKGTAPLGACNPGGSAVKNKISEIMGGPATDGESERKVAQLLCGGGKDKSVLSFEYQGLSDCNAAVQQFGGPKACKYGCVGFGTCVKVCPFGAIKMGPDRLPVIDPETCTGCNLCVDNCPQRVLKTVEISKRVHVRCSSKDKAKDAREACKVSCIKCKICEKNCPSDAIHVTGEDAGVAMIDYAKCTDCGVCAEKCPTKAIELIKPIRPEICLAAKTPDTSAGCGGCTLCK